MSKKQYLKFEIKDNKSLKIIKRKENHKKKLKLKKQNNKKWNEKLK